MSSESTENSVEPDLVFVVTPQRINNDENSTETGEKDEDLESEESRNILSIFWKNGKIGAAYYSLNEKLLYVYDELQDFEPYFLVTRTIYREIQPVYVIALGSRSDEFVKMLINLMSFREDTTTSDSAVSIPKDFCTISLKEYPFDTCKAVLSNLTVASIPEALSEIKTKIYIQSLINFDYKRSVHAAGALVKFLEKSWAYFSTEKNDLIFLHLFQISLKTHVLMNWNSFNALQVFQKRSHEANSKKGLQGANREGLSVFKLFSSKCESRIGQRSLRNLLLKPINDVCELNGRLDFIEFVLMPARKEFIEALRENIKELCEINKILVKIKNSKANAGDWHVLYKTIHHIMFISELGSPYKEESPVINNLYKSISTNLISLKQTIQNALDFSSLIRRGRPIIKFGLDESLDAKKLQKQDISKHVTAAARIAVNELPDFINECTVVYLPEMGHLIAVKEWEPDCDPDTLRYLGFRFMFTIRGTIHYKNPMCVELDKHLGDINTEIIAHENRIVDRLSIYVLKYNNDIRKPLEIIAFMDSLIAIALISIDNNYTRPSYNGQRTIEISKARHPLMELVSPYTPNDFRSGGPHPHMRVVTGPNASGKSIYLKQTGVIVFLAHVGAYVPASEANIGMVDFILVRMQTSESACIRLSAFMLDISVATQAITMKGTSSLILMDEFGRGTLEKDAVILLASVLKHFLRREEKCPHVIITTHFQNLVEYLPGNQLLEYLRMEHELSDGWLVFLYKVVKGVSGSYAFDIAREAGLSDDVLERAEEFYRSISSSDVETLKLLS